MSTEDTEIENHNMISIEKIKMQNGTGTKKFKHEEEYIVADGGTRAWLVMLGSFFCNGILFGIINSYGVLYTDIRADLERRNYTNAAGKASLPGSFAMGTTFFMSSISGVLTDYMGIRKTTFLGGFIASGGMLLSSFTVGNISLLCITFGVMFGLGGAFSYTPSLAVLGHYFHKRLGLVNGIVTAGSSAFTVVMPYVIGAFLQRFGLIWTLRLLAFIVSFIMLCAVLFRPVKQERVLSKENLSKQIFNSNLLKNTKYIIWTTVIALSLFGYFVPYVYIINFVKEKFPDVSDGGNKLPLLCIGIMSGVGRLVCGYLADQPRVDRILIQQISFLVLGVLTIILPYTQGKFPLMIFICLSMGVVDGCFVSLLGPIAFQICGREAATQAIGFLLGVASIPLIVGPYVAGLIYEVEKDYTLPFILAGIPPTIGSIAMFATRAAKRTRQVTSAVQEPLNGNGKFCQEPVPAQEDNNIT